MECLDSIMQHNTPIPIFRLTIHHSIMLEQVKMTGTVMYEVSSTKTKGVHLFC